MQRQSTITQPGQGSAPAATQNGIKSTPSSRITPGDKVLIFDALVSQNLWIIVGDVLITNGRTKLRSGNMDFYFDDSLVIAHQKGGRR